MPLSGQGKHSKFLSELPVRHDKEEKISYRL